MECWRASQGRVVPVGRPGLFLGEGLVGEGVRAGGVGPSAPPRPVVPSC